MTTFPDPEFLQQLVGHHRRKALTDLDAQSEMLIWSGVSLNWIADFLTDENAHWEKQDVEVDSLTLTGTNPEWNAIIIDQCERSPIKFRKLLESQPEIREKFTTAIDKDFPILIRMDEGKMKILDGMHRVIGAILGNRKTLMAYVCTSVGQAKPHCEPHVVYDLLRSYDRKINTDRGGLIAAVQYLRKSYANVDQLLRERFSGGWMQNDEIKAIIGEILNG